MSKNKPTRRTSRLGRRSSLRPEIRRLLVVCEGQKTEPNYFRGLREEDDVGKNFRVRVREGRGGSVERILTKAIDFRDNSRKKYDEVWVIADIERGRDTESLERAVKRAEKENVTLCLSNPCFEVWVLAHFTQKTRPFNDCDAVISEVRKERNWSGYSKGDEIIYTKLKETTTTAILNAKRGMEVWRETTGNNTGGAVDFNSSTEVYLLVSQLLGQ